VDALTEGSKAEELDKPSNIADKLLEDLTQNSGILRGGGTQGYFFLHLIIQEFLAASFLARLVNKNGWKTEIDVSVIVKK
jgi:hypothetical protein